ncbi:LysR family transcriptional regulator [Ideonella sp.]|uniref:LysR family transcriptional regulator n=1 Tax=Ideonella sp. TaxID=1929293 RepID=UPI0035ADF384
METYQLKTFVTVAREGSITRASELLYLSQPAVSAHIKAIEEEFDLTLFERTPRGMVLTPNGSGLLVHAEQSIAMHQQFIEQARRLKGLPSGRLRLGLLGRTDPALVSRWMSRLVDRWPDLAVTVEHGSSAQVADGLQCGHLDVGFFMDEAGMDTELHGMEVATRTLHLAAPKGWAAPDAEPDWRALVQRPWISPACRGCCGQSLHRLFAQLGEVPRRLISLDQPALVPALVTGGVGLGFVHDEVSRTAGFLAAADLVGGVHFTFPVRFGCLASRTSEPAVQAALQTMREVREVRAG